MANIPTCIEYIRKISQKDRVFGEYWEGMLHYGDALFSYPPHRIFVQAYGCRYYILLGCEHLKDNLTKFEDSLK